MLRYRTRDITRLGTERCACGRTTARIDWFTGRVDDSDYSSANKSERLNDHAKRISALEEKLS